MDISIDKRSRSSHSGKKVIKSMGTYTTTKLIALFPRLVVFALFGTAFAQTPTVVSTRIVTVPNGLQVEVDGQVVTTPLSYLWPAGSRHTIHAFDQITPDGAVLSKFLAFATPTNGLITATPGTLIVSADKNVPEIDVQYTNSFLVRVVYFDCGPGYSDPDRPCPQNLSPGTVNVGGTVFTQSGFFYGAGLLTLQATPSPAAVGEDSPWIFVGWYSGLGNDSQAFVNSVNVTGPTSIYPRFVRGRKMTLQSSPPGLQIVADHQTVRTPATLIWGTGTTHTLGSVPDQVDTFGKPWVFDSWSDGGSLSHSYQVPDGLLPLTVTANFLVGQRVSFFTNPPGLTLSIDGRSNWVSNNFTWAVDSEHSVSAPLTQVDASGTTYKFVSWSQGGPASQVVTAKQDPNGLNLAFTATYEGSGRITVVSETSGVVIKVDGQDCPLPCTIEKARGTSIRLQAPTSIPLTEDSRLDFVGWNDSAQPDRTITAPSGPLTLTLYYKLLNKLSAAATPPEGARFTTDPASADSYFDAQANVLVSVETKTGFKFHNWDGDTTGTARSVTLNMGTPKYVRAILDRVPALRDGAVKNAAGDTPLNAVAPGSIVSIYGVNLASELKVGPASPLTQTLANVTVRVGSRLLPLLFVSSEQINAQMPSDLTDGDYTLTVHQEDNPDVSANFTVARNAPGLFNRVIGGKTYGLFLHENGDAITSDSPARRNEVVSLLATGLGPYLSTPPLGFAAVESDTSVLTDRVTIVAGDNTIDPTYAGAAGGRVGVTAIRFRISSNLPGSGDTQIKVRIADQDSNTVLLPVE